MTSLEYAQLAAMWWRDKIENPTKTPHELVGVSEVEGFGFSMVHNALARPSSDQLDMLELALTDCLVRAGAPTSLGVDYQPYGVLVDALRIAGVERCRLPLKTRMEFLGGGTTVKYGYYGSWESAF